MHVSELNKCISPALRQAQGRLLNVKVIKVFSNEDYSYRGALLTSSQNKPVFSRAFTNSENSTGFTT